MVNENSWMWNLPSDVCGRLGACHNTKEDISALVNIRWAWMKSHQEKFKKFTKEDALIYVLELLDANSQWQLANLTCDEYNELKRE